MVYQDEFLDRQRVVQSQRRVDSILSGAGDATHADFINGTNIIPPPLQQYQQQQQQQANQRSSHHSSSTATGGQQQSGNTGAGAAVANASFQGSHFSRVTSQPHEVSLEVLRDSSFLEHGVDDECCCCECPSSCIRPLKTCVPKTMLCLDNNLPPALHWTCLSAVAIDVGSIVSGGLHPITFMGVWMTGLTMQVMLTRHLVRRRLGLGSATLNDASAAMFCPCLAATQQHQELVLKRSRAGLRESWDSGLVFGQWLPPQQQVGLMGSGRRGMQGGMI